jgi:hypothetical protein
MRTLRPSLEQSLEQINANTLKEFILEPHSNIADDKAIELSEALKNNTSLEVFSLSSIEVSDTAAQSIAEGLANHPKLNKLILVGKKISVQGIYLFIDILPTLKKLTWFTLEKTTIGNEGIKRLGGVVTSCEAINQLMLSDNQITDEGVSCFIDYVKPIKRFIYIDLGSNNLSDLGLTLTKQAMLDYSTVSISTSCSKYATLEYRKELNRYTSNNLQVWKKLRQAAAQILKIARLMHGVSQVNSKTSAISLPGFIKKYILRFFDGDNMLSPEQISNIYEYASDRRILKSQHEEFDFLVQVSCDRPKQYAQRVSFFKPCIAAIEVEKQPSRSEKRKGDTSEALLPLVGSPSKKANTAVV